MKIEQETRAISDTAVSTWLFNERLQLLFSFPIYREICAPKSSCNLVQRLCELFFSVGKYSMDIKKQHDPGKVTSSVILNISVK